VGKKPVDWLKEKAGWSNPPPTTSDIGIPTTSAGKLKEE